MNIKRYKGYVAQKWQLESSQMRTKGGNINFCYIGYIYYKEEKI